MKNIKKNKKIIIYIHACTRSKKGQHKIMHIDSLYTILFLPWKSAMFHTFWCNVLVRKRGGLSAHIENKHVRLVTHYIRPYIVFID